MCQLTPNSISDDQAAEDLLEQEQEQINSLTGDGAYDKRKVYAKCQNKGISKIIIPPQKNAKIWKHGNCKSPPHPIDENLRQIRKMRYPLTWYTDLRVNVLCKAATPLRCSTGLMLKLMLPTVKSFENHLPIYTFASMPAA